VVDTAITRAVQAKAVFELEHRVVRADGSIGWTLSRAVPMLDAGGELVEWFGAASDVSQRREAEAALRTSEASLATRVNQATAELRALSRRLLVVQEEERRHLARELHDEIGQVLTGLGFQLSAGADPDVARRIVEELTAQVRQMSMDLRPAALDAYGLLPALAWHIERYQTRTGIQVDLRHQGVNGRFPGPVEISAYRVVQEALTNVARHAGATLVSVQLLAGDGTLTLSIRDRGRGFNPDDRPMSSGLGGMRERVELLGGTTSIESAPGGGTSITVEIPLPELDPAEEEHP
jgi:signal transduction histidine kinase